MSKFDLRDITQRLSVSQDTDAVVSEFLGYLQAARSDWRAALAFYEVSHDALASVYTRAGQELERRDISLAVDRLPAPLVRKFFHPNAFSNDPGRKPLLGGLFQEPPCYEPSGLEMRQIGDLLPEGDWQSCLCMPLADQEDLLAMLVLVSPKRGAFGARVAVDLLPVKSLAAQALAQQLYRASHVRREATVSAAADFQERIRRLAEMSSAAEEDSRAQAEQLLGLTHEMNLPDDESSHFRQELANAKEHLSALKEQSSAARLHLDEAYSQLSLTQERMADLERTVGFLQDLFQAMSQEHDVQDFPPTLLAWFSEHFGVERCSLMILDGSRDTLRIIAQRGIDPAVAARAKVRVGHSIAGWVAHHRKPLFVRAKTDAGAARHTGQDVYNSDSFIAVPVIHAGRVVGVLNLSNKQGGLPFEEIDLERAMLTSSLLAMGLAGQDVARKTAAWA